MSEQPVPYGYGYDNEGSAGYRLAGVIPTGIGKKFLTKHRDTIEPIAGTLGNLGGTVAGGAAAGGSTMGVGTIAGGMAGGMAGEHLAKRALGYENEEMPEAPPGYDEFLLNLEHALKTHPDLAALAKRFGPKQEPNGELGGEAPEQNSILVPPPIVGDVVMDRPASRIVDRTGRSLAGIGAGAGGFIAGREIGRHAFKNPVLSRVAGIGGGVIGALAARRIGRNLAEKGIKNLRQK